MNKIGIATSISALYNYDYTDTLTYFNQHHQFKSLQIFLNEAFVKDKKSIREMLDRVSAIENVDLYFHLQGELNTSFFENNEYLTSIAAIENQISHQGFILHFDHSPEIMEYGELLDNFKYFFQSPLLLELYFKSNNEKEYQQQLSKYQSLFSLYYKHYNIRPVIDIPRFYHLNNNIDIPRATHDVKLTLNLMKSKNLSVLLHLIDVCDHRQARGDFCSIGTGIIPYDDIFNYIRYNNIAIENIILEYEDKIKPLESLTFFGQ